MSKTVDEIRFESDRSLGYENRGSLERETLFHTLLFFVFIFELGRYHINKKYLEDGKMFGNIVERIENVIVQVNEVKVQFVEKDAKVAELEFKVAELEALLAAADEEIAALQVMVAAKDEEIAALQEKVVDEAEMEALQDAVNRLENAFVEPIE